jgi:hypothetical protein
MPGSSCSLVITIKPRAREEFLKGDRFDLLFYQIVFGTRVAFFQNRLPIIKLNGASVACLTRLCFLCSYFSLQEITSKALERPPAAYYSYKFCAIRPKTQKLNWRHKHTQQGNLTSLLLARRT